MLKLQKIYSSNLLLIRKVQIKIVTKLVFFYLSYWQKCKFINMLCWPGYGVGEMESVRLPHSDVWATKINSVVKALRMSTHVQIMLCYIIWWHPDSFVCI